MKDQSTAQSDFLEWAVLLSLVLVIVAVFGFSLFNAGGEALRQFGKGLGQ